ncbi:MAG: sugar transferase, partial [Oscillospiraceae bacterium]
LKRIFDIAVSALLIAVLSPLLLTLAVVVKIDSRGPVFYRQLRVTQNLRDFSIYKFRSMVANADRLGGALTLDGDKRITRAGSVLRRTRLDELPQLFNILRGEMSFVGTRPEVREYVDCYTEEMYATLLLPAGVTSRASIEFIGESELLNDLSDADFVYVSEILPRKMKYNLEYLQRVGPSEDMKILLATVGAVSMK